MTVYLQLRGKKFHIPNIASKNIQKTLIFFFRSHYLRWKVVDDELIPAEFDLNARPRRQDWEGDIVETGMFYFSRRRLVKSGLLQNNR